MHSGSILSVCYMTLGCQMSNRGLQPDLSSAKASIILGNNYTTNPKGINVGNHDTDHVC